MNIDAQIYFERFQQMVISTSPMAGKVTLILFGLIILAMLINWIAMEKALAKTIEAMQAVTVLTPGLFFMFLFASMSKDHLTAIMQLTGLWVAMTLAPYVTLILLRGVAITMNAPQETKPKTRAKQGDVSTT